MSKARVLVATAVLFVSGCFVASAGSAPQAPWQLPAADLTVTGSHAENPGVAIAPDGRVAVIWDRFESGTNFVQLATREPGGSFGASVNLSPVGQYAEYPQIVFAPDGSATAIWLRRDGPDDIVQAATSTPGGSFAAPVNLSEPGEDASKPRIAIGADGTATVVWQRPNGPDDVVQAVTRSPGGGFGLPQDLSAIGEDSRGPSVAIADDGTTTVVWRRSDGANTRIQAATRPFGGSFGSAVNISEPGEPAFAAQIANAPDGTSTAVWYRSDGSNDRIQAATRPAGGSFGTPVSLSAAGEDAGNPQVAVAADGTATVLWSRSNGVNEIVQAATRAPGGSFAAPVNLSDPGNDSEGALIAVAPDGTATAVWNRAGGTPVVQSGVRPPGGSFGSPVNLSGGVNPAFSARIAVGPDGSASSAWVASAGWNIIQSASTAQPSPALTVSRLGLGSGTVSSSPGGIDCGSDCAENFPSYTTVTLSAAAKSGSTFEGWGGACSEVLGENCQVTILDATEVSATFSGPAKLRVARIKPKNPKVRRGKKVKIKVTGKNVGTATARNSKICIKLSKSVKKKLKPKGKKCKKLGSMVAGKARTKPFKLKATGKAKKGKKYMVKFKLTAKAAKAATKAVRVKVK